MHLKSFLAGLASGAALFALIDALVSPGSGQAPSIGPPKHSAGGLTDPENARAVRGETARLPAGDRTNEPDESESAAQAGTSPENRAPFPRSLPQSSPQDFLASARSRLDAQPLDPSWSPFSEQAIQQFWGRHAQSALFTLEHIECRAMTCQIAVTGVDERAFGMLQNVIFDMRHEPWYEFGDIGISAGNVDGRFMVIAEM